jgi:glycosyltransferase involved in cell wall biosynthesis
VIKPKVTVLVPSFNHDCYLKKRIESITAQTYDNYELIVVDDCSIDDSAAIITSLQKTHGFRYIANKKNSGTPFAAWEHILSIANGDYIWICESDDYADPIFLDCAVEAIRNVPNAVIAYCDSWIIDEDDNQIDHTDTYFRDTWRESRWDNSFVQDGNDELNHFQLRGQTVPNMSSMLISTDAFRKAFRPFMRKLKLTGDWLFVGLLMKYGKVVYFKKTLNYFRRHESTARVRVKSARSQAEFILTKYLLFLETKRPRNEFASVMSTDAVRFLYEPARFREVLITMMKTSFLHTLGVGVSLAASLLVNRDYLKKFYHRRQLIKRGT